MTVKIEDMQRITVVQMEEFLRGTRDIAVEQLDRPDRLALIAGILRRLDYGFLDRKEKGIVRKFLMKVGALGSAQVTRRVRQWRQEGKLEDNRQQRARFPRRYTNGDIALLVKVDEAHQQPSGPAVRRILKREYEVYGRGDYQRLSRISASHLYNLRRSKAYRDRYRQIDKTQSVVAKFGERRKPEPNGAPGHLRIDTVHQGKVREPDGTMSHGIYHINAVDTVTQWEVVGCVKELNQQQVSAAVAAMADQFPFPILGFHFDNGSEFINKTMAKLIQQMGGDYTKSRAYQTTDNALVEGKNGAVIRKHMGYGLFREPSVRPINDFYRQHLNPYVNFHRPCGFATVTIDARGKKRRSYRPDDYRTPYEKLTSLEKWEQYLKPGVTAKQLEQQAKQCSDTEAAIAMQNAKWELCCQAIGSQDALERTQKGDKS